MPNNTLPFEDWKDFFTRKLINTGLFTLSSSDLNPGTDIEIYSAIKNNPYTRIELGYFSPMTLIYLHIFNPETPGKNRQQQIDYFYSHHFNEQDDYGPPGLDFNEINIQGISNYLAQGFNGSEKVFYRNGKAVKSIQTSSYYPDSPITTTTYHFNKENFFQNLFKKIIGTKEEFDMIKEIDLRTVFNGIKSS